MRRRSRNDTASTNAKDGKKKRGSHKRTWKLFDKGATVLAGALATQISGLTWRAATGKRPPTSPAHPEIRLAEAVTWAALAGATVELTKIVINRKAVDYWVRSTGELPPGLKPNKHLTKK